MINRFMIEFVRNNHENPTKSHLTSTATLLVRAASWGPCRLQVPRRSLPEMHFFSEQSHVVQNSYFDWRIHPDANIPFACFVMCFFLYLSEMFFSNGTKRSLPSWWSVRMGENKSLASHTCNTCGARFD
jgi:hypothetical protein